jgi:hypothetical protein
MPEDSFMPILLALALTAFFAGLLIHAWWLIILSFLAGLAFLFGWVWPHRELGQTRSAEHV